MVADQEDIEFLVRSSHRIEVLETLAAGAFDRTSLRRATGASAPTMGRILADFEDRRWIERDGPTYRLTGLGAFVADHYAQFSAAMAAQRHLQEVWPWLPHDIDGFDIRSVTDVVVSQPGPGYPYEPIERLTDLISTTDTMRGFGMALLKSGNLEPFFDHTLDGLECEYIYPSAVFEELLAWDEATVVEAASRANYTVMLHDELPLGDRCGISVFDDRVCICCYDPETGALRSLFDTGSDELRAWAESYYGRFRAEARPLDDVAEWRSVE